MISFSMEFGKNVDGISSVANNVVDGDESTSLDEIHHMLKQVFGS